MNSTECGSGSKSPDFHRKVASHDADDLVVWRLKSKQKNN